MRFGDLLVDGIQAIKDGTASPGQIQELKSKFNLLSDDYDVMRGWLQTGQSRIADVAINFPFALIQPQVLSVPSASWNVKIPGVFSHLMIGGSGKMSTAGVVTYLNFRLNSDSGTNYDTLSFIAGSSGPASSWTGGNTSSTIGAFQGTDANANSSGNFWAIVPAYRSSLWKSVISLASWQDVGAGGGGAFATFSTYWKSTSPISSITLYPASGLMAVGSTLSVYGIL